MKSDDKIPIIFIILGIFVIIVSIMFYPSDFHSHEDRIKNLEMQVEVLREKCDDLTLLVNRVNAIEAIQQHQQETLGTIDWAMKYRY